MRTRGKKGGDGSREEEPPGHQDPLVAEHIDNLSAHRLLRAGQDMVHEWSVIREEEEVPVLTLKGGYLLDAVLEQISRIREGGPGNEEFRYQRFAGWDDSVVEDLEGEDMVIGLVRENGDTRIRITTGEMRYEVQYMIRAWKGPTPVYMTSRLNSVGCSHVVDQLGIGYWNIRGRIMPWMSVTRYPDSMASGFSPFLSDLNSLTEKALSLDHDKLERFLRRISSDLGGGSVEISRNIGKSLADVHGSLMLEGEPVAGKRGEGNRITDLFSRSSFAMEDIGSLLGMFSSYMDEVRKGLYRKLGDVPPPVVSRGKKQKVVKRRGKDGVGREPGLSLLRGALVSGHDHMRSRFAGIRRFRGSPMVPVGLDPGLDRILISNEDQPLFRKFDWSFYDREDNAPKKTLPLKDLALIVSSMNKARYLSARRIFSSATKKRENKQLELMFLDYNISKDGYLSMMGDLKAISMARSRDTPFRYVVIPSIVSSLWFEKCRNALILGYNEGLSGTDCEDLLVYPRGADTMEGIRLYQMLSSLSSAAGSLSRKRGSEVSLESDLLCALSV